MRTFLYGVIDGFFVGVTIGYLFIIAFHVFRRIISGD